MVAAEWDYKKMKLHLTAWWHRAISLSIGAVVPVTTSRVHHLISGSAK